MSVLGLFLLIAFSPHYGPYFPFSLHAFIISYWMSDNVIFTVLSAREFCITINISSFVPILRIGMILGAVVSKLCIAGQSAFSLKLVFLTGEVSTLPSTP